MTRHPPFYGLGASSTTDFTTREGAGELAQRIADAWAKVGVVCVPKVVAAVPGSRDARATVYGVEFPAGFVNGLPPRSAIVGEAKAGSLSP